MVVRMRSTRSHTGNRRAHHALEAAVLVKCANCGESVAPHSVCKNCGYYRGKKVLDLVRKMEKKQKKEKEKKART